MVYVINQDGTPLMPCKPVVARLLLKSDKAKVLKRTPFTIKLLYQTTSYTQDLTLGVDTGSSKIGSAVVDKDNNVMYASEVEIRNDISKKMERRSKYRRTRRSRKTRYRKPRWLNRRNSIKEDRFSPTMVSKINSHLKEIRFVESILPITNIVLETATFDPHALKNPAVLKNKWLYQKGVNYGYGNTRAYVLSRDNYTCQHCRGKSKDRMLHVHHVVFSSKGGSDNHENLIVLCKTCHDLLHRGKITLKKAGKAKGMLRHATQMNSIRIQLLKLLPEARETFGFITKEHRQIVGLPKKHFTDAIMIACLNNIGKSGIPGLNFKASSLLVKKCIAKGDYQQTKGIRSEKRIPTGKIQGFRKFDKVRYLGQEYFIKGRMSSGYAVLMDIYGEKAEFKDAPRGMKTPKLANIQRVGARKSWMIQSQKLSQFIS